MEELNAYNYVTRGYFGRRRPLRSRTFLAYMEMMYHLRNSPQLQTQVDSDDQTEPRPVSEENIPSTDVEMTSTDELVPLVNSKDSESKLVEETSIGKNKENDGLQEEASSDKHMEGSGFNDIDSIPDEKQKIASAGMSSLTDFSMVEKETDNCTIQIAENQSDNCTIQVVENQDNECAIQIPRDNNDTSGVVDIQMEHFGELEQLEVDKEFSVNDFSEILDSCYGLDMDVQPSVAVDGSHENGTTFEDTCKESERGLKLKEMELKKLMYDSSAVELTSCPNTNDDIEEGEISGDCGFIDASSDELTHASPDFLDKGEFTSDRSDVSHMQYERADPSPNGKAIDMEVENRPTILWMQDQNLKNVICNGSATTQYPISVAPCMGNQIAADKSTQQNASENQISDTTKQDGDMEQKKRKRGLSKERRAKKKKKERINRAIKNRELGVKRLKLPPIVKQKKIVYCRHYLQGRCHEGEKCKFSHDTVPLTKSKPCGHFARRTCMKGDDCPYDHDLSKYPCKNYTTNGFCNRGSDCLFSHEKPATQSSSAAPNASKPDCTPTKLTIPVKEGPFTASKVSKLDVKLPSSLSYLNSFKLTNEHGSSGTKIDSKPLPAGNSPNVSAGSASRTARKIPKGITFLNGGTALGESSSSKLDGSSSKASVGDSTGLKAVDATGSANRTNEKSGRAALKTPRGINFLSFAQPPSSELSSKGFSQLFPNRNNEPGKPVGGNTGEGELTGSFLESVGTLKVNGQMNRSATCLVPGMNEIVNGAPMTMEQSINFSPVDEIVSRERKDPSRQPQSSAKITSLSFIEPGDQSTGKQNADFSSSVKSTYLPNAPSSVQKAIKSTLAFAAKFETAIKIGSSLGREGS